jgi:hypothetical protein
VAKRRDAGSRRVVYSRYITLRSGKRLYASAYGLKAFRFEVRKDRTK